MSAANYVYGDAAHKHAVTTAGALAMTYDANGNMISRNGSTISWKSYNQPYQIYYGSNQTTFWYGASHQRYKQDAVYAGVHEITFYIGGLLEKMNRGSQPAEYRHLIPAGSGTAIYTRRADLTNATFYATSDHLGSADLVLDSAATVVARESFAAFGARRGSNWQGTPTAADYTAFANTTRKGFTGHEMLDSVNIVNMNGRVYDPFLGRFLSADTVIQNLAATASINPFAYAWDNPLKYIDPSGHSLLGDLLGVLAAVVAAVIIIYMGGAALGLVTAAGHLTILGAMVCRFVGGFVGALVSTGSLSAALTAAAFFEAGTLGQGWSKPANVLAHAAVGCGSAMLSGGNCGRGALSAAVAEQATLQHWIPAPAAGQWGTNAEGTVAAGIVGGVSSAITGGNFKDGFSVGAAGYLFNAVAHAANQGRNVVYTNDDGSTDTRSGGSLSLRDNNPGNMRDGAGGVDPIAYNTGPGTGTGFAIFASESDGYDAMIANLDRPLYQNLNVGDAIATWAPTADNNDPVAYANAVAAMTGIPANTHMATLTAAQLGSVAGAIQTYEGWAVGTITHNPPPH